MYVHISPVLHALFIFIPLPTQDKLKTKLDNALTSLGEQKEKWRSRLDDMSAKASRASSRVNDEKAKARRLVQQQLDSELKRRGDLFRDLARSRLVYATSRPIM